MKSKPEFKEYKAPAGGWGSVQSVGRSLARDRVPVRGTQALRMLFMPHNDMDRLELRPEEIVSLVTAAGDDRHRQKACAAGASFLVGVSAPTALAIRIAEAAGVTLVGIARDDGFEVFTHPERLEATPASNAA